MLFFWTAFIALYTLALGNSNNSNIAPLSVPPSLFWDGNDGWWSTFHVQLGTPGQTVRLLPGTSASAGTTTWVVIPQGCTLANPGLQGCDESRGSLFQSNRSSTWSTEHLANTNKGALYHLNTVEESFLDLTGNAYYGFDTISLGLPGSGLPSMENQIIAGFAENSFWLGSLGLSPVSFNFTDLNDPQPSLMGNLRSHSLIPSSSWAYTAGAHYQAPPVFGSLTLGGYDTTRFTPNNVSFAMGADFSRDLLVRLDSITYDTIGSSPLLASSIDIFIDSLVTHLWLPVDVCKVFEKRFKLTWNATAELYLIDNDVHDALLAQNPTFTFTLGQSGVDGGQTVDIVLPYSALDLEVTKPLVASTARYFPLKQAKNSTQYTLGRVFLQEAYIIADYERHEFSVSQALFPSTAVSQKIVAIEPPSTGEKGVHSPEKADGLSLGVLLGIAVGGGVAIILLIVAAFWCFCCRRGKVSTTAHSPRQTSIDEKRPTAKESISGPMETAYSYADVEMHGESYVRELDGRRLHMPELQGTERANGRHELGLGVKRYEMGGPEVIVVELEAQVAPR